MQHVVTRPTEPFPICDGALVVHQIPSWQDNLVWLLVSADGSKAAAVDGPESDTVLAYAAKIGAELTTILNTHTHPDHVGINRGLAKASKLEGMQVIGAASRAKDIPGLTKGVEDGSTLDLFGAEGRVLDTPGHIDGHVSFVFGDAVFCGDTLFGAGCGYLFDGPAERMHESLQKLAALDPATRVCCAHEYTQDNLRFAWSVEPDNEALAQRIRQAWALRRDGGCTVPSTIATELATNPFLRPHAPTIRASVAAAFPDRSLASDADVFAATRALKDRKDYKERGDEGLPL